MQLVILLGGVLRDTNYVVQLVPDHQSISVDVERAGESSPSCICFGCPFVDILPPAQKLLACLLNPPPSTSASTEGREWDIKQQEIDNKNRLRH